MAWTLTLHTGKGRGEKEKIFAECCSHHRKKEKGKEDFSPTHTRNVLYRPRFKGREDPSSFSKNTTDFSERKGRRKKNCNGEGGRRESNFLFFPSPAHPCKTFFLLLLLSLLSLRRPIFVPSSPLLLLWRGMRRRRRRRPPTDAQHTLSPPRLFFAVVESFSIFGRRVYKIRHGFWKRGGACMQAACVCVHTCRCTCVPRANIRSGKKGCV